MKAALFLKIFLTVVLALGAIFYVFSPQYIFAQACNSSGNIKVENGFLSLVNSSNSNFSINNSYCVSGNQASIPNYSFPSFADMKSVFYDQVKSTTPKPKPLASITQNDITGTDTLYSTDGNATFSGDITGTRGPKIIFITGSLLISGNLAYADSDDSSGIVFVVGGNVDIDWAVTQVNAVIITFGTFCSASNGDFSSGISCPASSSASQLLIKGGVISLADPTAVANASPQFVRNNAATSNTTAAEHVIFQPKYLIILKGVFSRDLKIWKEL